VNLKELLERSVTQLGYDLVDLELSNRGRLLRLFIDKSDGVNIDDCELVSNQLSHLLTVENEVDYDRLEVSSPGLDRVLKKETDFERFVGSKVQIKLRIPMAGRKKYVGMLRGVESGEVLLEQDGELQRFALLSIEKARLVPEF
jgi:ribosome maturation factor RimP